MTTAQLAALVREAENIAGFPYADYQLRLIIGRLLEALTETTHRAEQAEAVVKSLTFRLSLTKDRNNCLCSDCRDKVPDGKCPRCHGQESHRTTNHPPTTGGETRASTPTTDSAGMLSAIVAWLEKHQPDVFQRGLWDAISTTTPTETGP